MPKESETCASGCALVGSFEFELIELSAIRRTPKSDWRLVTTTLPSELSVGATAPESAAIAALAPRLLSAMAMALPALTGTLDEPLESLPKIWLSRVETVVPLGPALKIRLSPTVVEALVAFLVVSDTADTVMLFTLFVLVPSEAPSRASACAL